MKIKNIPQKIFYICIVSILLIINYLIAKNININNSPSPSFLNDDGGLYANIIQKGANTNTWQKWENYNGENANEQNMYFILPKTEDNGTVEIYNNYADSIVIGKKTIPAKSSMNIKYKEGEEILVSNTNVFYKLIIYNSDAESSIFINDYSKSFVDYNGEEMSTDLYSFLIKDKRNSVSNLKCTVINNSKVTNTTLKEITGRGNTTWFNNEKKTFNIEFYDKMKIGELTSKEMCIIPENCDSTLIRNKIAYDLASDVGLPYSPKISYIDFYINGEYKGFYQIVEKVDLKKDALINLENNSKKMNKDFNFLVEVDVYNYYNDLSYITDNGYRIVVKEPNINFENENDANMKLKYNFIKEKYQNFENILYNGTLEELEKVCDLNSMATMYLIQEFGRNCDAGYTSTYFLYNAKEERFYVAPIWDCDCMFGSVETRRIGANTYPNNYKEWFVKYLDYNGKTNSLGQCFNLKGKTKAGKTFEELCISIWKEKFLPTINILLNQNKSKERVKNIEEYKENIEKSMYCNYIKWKMDTYYNVENSRLDTTYTKDYQGEVEYLKDWIEKRTDWISTEFGLKEKEQKDNSYYLVGDNIGGWERTSEENKLIENEDGTYSIKKLFTANTEYKLMIVDNYNRKYRANYYDYTTIDYSYIDKELHNASFVYENDTELIITLEGDFFTISPVLGTEKTKKPISPKQKIIYFKNSLKWQNICYYDYGDKYESYPWPGRKAELIAKDEKGNGIYKAVTDENQEKIIFSNGELDGQTDIMEIILCNENEIYEPNEDNLYEKDKRYRVFTIKKAEENINDILKINK